MSNLTALIAHCRRLAAAYGSFESGENFTLADVLAQAADALTAAEAQRRTVEQELSQWQRNCEANVEALNIQWRRAEAAEQALAACTQERDHLDRRAEVAEEEAAITREELAALTAQGQARHEEPEND